MQINKAIAELENGDEIEGSYLLRSAAVRTTASGKPFLSASIGDRTGAIDAKMWDYSGPIGASNEGGVVRLRGRVTDYRGSLQLIIDRLALAKIDEVEDVSRIVPVAPIDTNSAKAEIEAIVSSIEDGDYRRLSEEMLRRFSPEFWTMPAAKTVHHSFISGLMMHTLYMLRAADFMAGLYSDICNRSLLLAGTLMHDMAKADEFSLADTGLANGYSVRGQLLGHICMGAQYVAEAAYDLEIPEDKSVLLQHMILSHHGEPEFGAAVLPACVESELLAFLDRVDSRMEIYRETFRELPAGEFSNRIPFLEKRIYRHE